MIIGADGPRSRVRETAMDSAEKAAVTKFPIFHTNMTVCYRDADKARHVRQKYPSSYLALSQRSFHAFQSSQYREKISPTFCLLLLPCPHFSCFSISSQPMFSFAPHELTMRHLQFQVCLTAPIIPSPGSSTWLWRGLAKAITKRVVRRD